MSRTKKILLNLSLLGAIGIIAPTIINDINSVVKNIQNVVTFTFNATTISTQTSFKQGSKTFQDVQGNIWVSTANGLFKSVDQGKTFDQVGGTSLPQNIPNTLLLQDGQGNYWVCSGQTGNYSLYRSTDGLNFTNVFIPTETSPITFIKMIKDSAGSLWLATNAGLFESLNQQSFLKVTTGLPTNFNPLDIFQALNGTFYTADATHVYSSPYGMTFTAGKGTGLPATMGQAGFPSTYPTFYQAPNGNVFLTVNWKGFRCTDGANPASLDTFAEMGSTLGYLYFYCMYIDRNNNIWVNMNQGAGTTPAVGEVFKSTDGGVTFTSLGDKTLIIEAFFQDKQGNIWMESSTGLRLAVDGGSLSANVFLSGSSIVNMAQEKLGKLWVLANTGAYVSLSEAYNNTGYTTQGKTIDRQYNGLDYIFASRSVLFFAGDTTVKTVQVNTTTTTVDGKGFSQVLTSAVDNGQYSITVTYTDGTVVNYNFYIIDNSYNMAQFSTAATNTLKSYQAILNKKLVNVVVVRPNAEGGTPNIEMKLGYSGSDPIMNIPACAYWQVDPTTFAVKPNTRVAMTSDTTISAVGFYLVSLTDELGNSIQYYVQLANKDDNPYIPASTAPWSPVYPSNKIPKWMPIYPSKPVKKLIPINPSKPISRLIPVVPSKHISPWTPLFPGNPLSLGSPSTPVQISGLILNNPLDYLINFIL